MRCKSVPLPWAFTACALVTCCATHFARGATVPPLAAAGYAVLPAPQRVSLRGGEFRIDGGWHLERGDGVAEGDVAVESLVEGLSSRHGIHFGKADGPAIQLTIRPGSVAVGATQDRDKDALASEAYRLELGVRGIHLIANAAPGLFDGVQTLVQLAKRRDGAVWLPEGEITDWPDLQLRALYWDDAHHLERMEAFKQAIRQAAFFKINAFVLKLDGHFQYRHAPAVVEPEALSPEQLQELTDYGLRYHVQVIPYLDAPAHVAFILKHPEYAGLRAFPDSDYEMCVTNAKTYELLEGMYQDLLDANKGVRYFYLSTDEPYYLGMADSGKADGNDCSEAARRRESGSPGKLLAEFLTKAAGYLHDRGRTVVFWGEHPLKPSDVEALPAYLVNGETNGPEFNAAFKARGIRQMIYTSTEGEEKLFPDYFFAPTNRRLHPPAAGAAPGATPRVATATKAIATDSARKDSDLMGVFVAGWADMGLHPETFWLGYATITAAGWNPATADDEGRAATADFYRLFYGPSVRDMDRVYQLMSEQAQLWADTWDSAPSKLRVPIWGNSHEIYHPRHPAHDQTIPLPPAPPEDLSGKSDPGGGAKGNAKADWLSDNARRLELAEQGLVENDELLGLLQDNLRRAEFNRYNLEVFLSVARLCRQNLEMLRDLGRMEHLIDSARKSAASDPAAAVAALDEAVELARGIQRGRNAALRDATETWYKTWCPRVPEANGRKFLHVLDDVKDHLPDRTVGMDYLVYRELNLPVGEWVSRIQAARNAWAKAHQLPERDEPFDWRKTE